MNKATIITDAITYIEELKTTVEELSNQLLQMDAPNFVDQENIKHEEEIQENINKTVTTKSFHLFWLHYNINPTITIISSATPN